MTIVTRPSYLLRQALNEKYDKRIQAAQTDKEEARSQGDLSENFGYVEAKKDVENFRRMKAELQFDAPDLQIVEPADWKNIDMDGVPRAMIGAKLRILRGDKEETVLIGGAWDSDLENPKIIPYTSPLGRALIPKPPGFKTVLETSGETIEILSAEAPSETELAGFYAEKPAPEKAKKKPAPEIEM